MNLKKHFNIVVDKRNFGGDRVAVSVNKLHEYIPAERADFIRDKLLTLKLDKKRFKAQGCAVIDVYVK